MSLKITVDRGGETIALELPELQHFVFLDGDRIDVSGGDGEVVRTPDGCFNIRKSDGKAIRLPMQVIFSRFRDYILPEHLVVLTGKGTSSLDYLGKQHVYSYHKFMTLFPEMSFLEVGCGIGRDAFQLTDIICHKGRYIGLDVTQDAIDWCQDNITSRYPNFTFHHIDAHHELYNPLGRQNSRDFVIPVADKSIDRMSLGSVFTHLFEDEISHYMAEIGRVLKPGGLAYATFFLHSDETMQSVARTNASPLRFAHAYAEGCYVEDARYPTGAVAYTEKVFRRMFEGGGLELARPYIEGGWSGRKPDADDGQEVAVLTPRRGMVAKMFGRRVT